MLFVSVNDCRFFLKTAIEGLTRLAGTVGCGGHPHNEVRKIQVPRVKVANNTSPCQILGFYTVVKVASFVPPTTHVWGNPHNGLF